MKKYSFYNASQLRAQLGISKNKFHRMLEAGEITRVDKNIYVMARLTPAEVAWQFQWRYESYPLTGPSAMSLYDDKPLKLPLHFQIPRTKRARDNDWMVTTRRARQNDHIRKGLRVTPPVVAAADALGFVDKQDVRAFLQRNYGKRGGKALLSEDLETLYRVPADLQDILSNTALGTDSQLESRFWEYLKREGLDFDHNVYLNGYMWDFVACDCPLFRIEIGAFDFHRDTSSHSGWQNYVRDVWKMNWAVINGVLVLQFTAKCIDLEPERCVEVVKQALEWHRNPASPRPSWALPWNWHKGLRDEYSAYWTRW
ncbi:hypothetical protein [Corynebacterium sp.]|uniref:hypothetical protein n=1 Tax=Corynebacterium sp. TaxID=1720 RepID=UPI003736C133